MIKHIVAWSFIKEIPENQKETISLKIKNDLEGLKNIIDDIVEIKVFISIASTSNRDLMLYSEFENEQALAKYQTHYQHKKVSEYVKSVMSERVCLDYLD